MITDAKWAKQIAEELRYMRKVIRDDCGRTCICFVQDRDGKPVVSGLNSRVHGILDTAAMLLERFPE